MSSFLKTLAKGDSGRQLVCFPFLGGASTAYLPLSRALAPGVELLAVNPPGHGYDQTPLLTSMDRMVDFYCLLLAPRLTETSVFFGHSMGAVVAFLVLERLHRMPLKTKPVGLIQSACPSFRDAHPAQGQRMSALSDDALLDHIISMEGVPPELKQQRTLLECFVPAFRADYLALESARAPSSGDPLSVPLWQFYGSHDTTVSWDSLAEWEVFFQSLPTRVAIDGGHMYLLDRAARVASEVTAVFETLARSSRRDSPQLAEAVAWKVACIHGRPASFWDTSANRKESQ